MLVSVADTGENSMVLLQLFWSDKGVRIVVTIPIVVTIAENGTRSQTVLPSLEVRGYYFVLRHRPGRLSPP